MQKQTHNDIPKLGIDELSELLAAALGMPRPGTQPPKSAQTEPSSRHDASPRRTH